MRTWLRRTLITLAVLLVLGGAAYYWLFVESHMPDEASFAFDIDQVRAVSAAVPGEKPGAIEVEQVGVFHFPAVGIVAGDGWDARPLPVYSYRLIYPDGSIIVDTALPEAAGDGRLKDFDIAAYDRMQAAMSAAQHVVITHEHMDHIGGLTDHRDLANVLPQARLTKAQVSDPKRSLPAKFPDGTLDGYRPLEYEQYHALAPGVVLIKAAGHTPGSQMVYVQTADGAELLLIGDVAWHYRNIEVQRERARLMTMVFLQEDRTAVFGQLAALKRLHDAQPNVQIVPGHDGAVIEALVTAGILKRGFSP